MKARGQAAQLPAPETARSPTTSSVAVRHCSAAASIGDDAEQGEVGLFGFNPEVLDVAPRDVQARARNGAGALLRLRPR